MQAESFRWDIKSGAFIASFTPRRCQDWSAVQAEALLCFRARRQRESSRASDERLSTDAVDIHFPVRDRAHGKSFPLSLNTLCYARIM
jgi:hypothetical protein